MSDPTRSPASTRGQRGFSLLEVVVAAGLLALMLLVLLSLHERLTRHYALSQDRVVATQSTRLALARLSEELRLAGLNINPDGDPSRADEALEGMWAGAVTLRADLDLSDGAPAADPEATLGAPSARHAIVSTGNDEIVTWVLAPTSGGGTDVINFSSDVFSAPRDGGADLVQVDGVDLAQAGPPYTLYRVHVAPGGSGVVRQPVADQIRSLAFRYYDQAGTEILPVGGGDDAGSRSARAAVTRIAIELVGLTEHDDPGWIQAGEAVPSVRRRRRVTLRTEVLLGNRGLTGRADQDTEDPASPAGMSALSPVLAMPPSRPRLLDAAG